MSSVATLAPGRSSQRSALVRVGGRCALRCVLCDCTASPSTPAQVARALEGGGGRLLVRGAVEANPEIATLIARARQQGFAEIVLRTNATSSCTPAGAAAFARLGVDVALVPLFSQLPSVHDRIAQRERALRDALAGMRNLARAGVAVEIEIPILPPKLQNLEELVQLAQRVVPSLRGVRFYAPPFPVPVRLAPPPWDIAGAALARALLLCRALRITARLTPDEGVPLCALRDHPDLHDAYAFNPKRQASKGRTGVFGAVCSGCAVRAQCSGLVASYHAAHGEAGIAAYARRPALMYEQRTTRRRGWTREQSAAAARTELLVLRPTVNCNQDCTFCSANETSANVWTNHETMLRVIARAARRRIKRLSFSGGEPTLSKHLAEYVRCAVRLGIPEIEIVSNAVLLDKKEKVDALAEAGLTHAFISLHAHDEQLSQQSTQKIGDFSRTVQGIKHLLDAGVETALNHVITARNYPYLREYVEFVRREFGAHVKISFAFVTPQFKALDNIEVMPRLSEVMPYLKRAMYRALEIGQPFGVGSRQGIPFCFLDEFRAWSDGIDLEAAALAEDAPQKQRGPLCDSCRFSDQCVGLWRPYVAKYGFDELRPVPGAKLTAEQRRALDEFASARRWRVPSSFAEVPAIMREPALENGPPPVTALAISASRAFVPQRSRPLRVLLVGTGRQARRLARAARGVSGLSIDAVASPHALQAELRELGDCPAYSDAAAAMDDVRPEAVIIAAATAAHADVARMAIARRIPALVEKPLTRIDEEAVAVQDAARAAGVRIVPAHNSLYASGLDEVLTPQFTNCTVSYAWRRTPASSDTMRTWSRSLLYETVHHLLAIVGRAVGGGVGDVLQAAFRGDGAPESLRLDLRYGDARAEIVLDFAAAVEEDVLARRAAAMPETERVWRRHGRALSITSATGVRMVEAQGSDVERMLANFRDVVLGRAEPGASIAEAIDVMRTARRVVEAVSAAGAPFDRPTAPRHVASHGIRALHP